MPQQNHSAHGYSDSDLKKAVALFYDGRAAPTVTASGTGASARQIIEVAQAHGIPLCDNPALVDLLVTLELGESIPEALYLAVAHIIAFAYELQGKVPEGFTPPPR